MRRLAIRSAHARRWAESGVRARIAGPSSPALATRQLLLRAGPPSLRREAGPVSFPRHGSGFEEPDDLEPEGLREGVLLKAHSQVTHHRHGGAVGALGPCCVS